ncbi:MAG: sortase [Pseudonocardia sp.]|nr:sortase [Pseudonocardia sp.]
MKLLALLALIGAFLAGCSSPQPAGAGGSSPAPAPAPIAGICTATGADSTLTRTGMLPDGAPEVPPVTAPMQASWATWSPEPGQAGPATLYGHVDGQTDGVRGQPGIFNRIDDLRPGQGIVVDQDDDSAAVFTVYRVATYPKATLPEGEVYGDTPGPELRLVTCGGPFDEAAGSYRDQVVVFARLT